jgi:site-specific recombinase XerD
VVDGPLAAFVDGLRRELAGQGYAVDTIGDHVHLLADLSRWLDDRALSAQELTSQWAQEFLRDRRRRGCRAGLTARAIAPLLGYLRSLQVVPPPVAAVPATPEEMLLANYRDHLLAERGVTSGTVTHYLRCARTFLRSLGGPLGSGVAGLSTADVTEYVVAWANRRRGKAPDLVTLPALRSLLRYLHAAGLVAAPLADAVPPGHGYPRRALPRAVPPRPGSRGVGRL